MMCHGHAYSSCEIGNSLFSDPLSPNINTPVWMTGFNFLKLNGQAEMKVELEQRFETIQLEVAEFLAVAASLQVKEKPFRGG